MIETTVSKGDTFNDFNFVIEAPTAVYLQNAKWRLFLDYYSIRGEGNLYPLSRTKKKNLSNLKLISVPYRSQLI